MKTKRWGRWLMISGLLAVLALGTVALVTPEAEAKGPCVCPQIYAPVVCKGGKVYPNQCVADCRRAQDCEPLGAL